MATSYSYTERGEGRHGSGKGGGGVLPWLLGAGVVFVGFKMAKGIFMHNVVIPKETAIYAERLQITGAKFALDLKHKKVIIRFTVNNPNNKPMHIEAIVGRVTMSSNTPGQSFPIGNIDKFGILDLPPVSAKPVELTATLNGLNTAAYIAEVAMGKWKGQFVNFTGTITANGRPWPINETIKLSV